MESIPKRNLDLTSKCALKRLKRRGLTPLASCFRRFIPGIAIYYYIARCNKFIQIYSLNSAIPSFRNIIYSGDIVIPEIRHIYPWNIVIAPFRNRPQLVILVCYSVSEFINLHLVIIFSIHRQLRA